MKIMFMNIDREFESEEDYLTYVDAKYDELKDDAAICSSKEEAIYVTRNGGYRFLSDKYKYAVYVYRQVRDNKIPMTSQLWEVENVKLH